MKEDLGLGNRAQHAKRLSKVVDLLSRKWTIHVLFAMSDQPVRLSELKRQIPTASKKALTSSLRALEAEGLIVRRDLSDTVLHVEYEIVSAIRGPLLALLDCLATWQETA